MSLENQTFKVLQDRIGSDRPLLSVSVPGRVNLIGEHIDYHGLSVLPIAIQRRIVVSFSPREDRIVRAVSAYGEGEFQVRNVSPAENPGYWLNYVKAAASAAGQRWPLDRGIDAVVSSDLLPAAGLSSSTALLTAFVLALLTANEIHATLAELMEILPDGEHFVGTRGGGMDHAAVLAAPQGGALLISFAPFQIQPVSIPSDWSFLVAYSLSTAEKSGSLREQYNQRRESGRSALAKLGVKSYKTALESNGVEELLALAEPNNSLSTDEKDAFVHVVSESRRVRNAAKALAISDLAGFGELLTESHASLRDRLRVSSPALDRLVECALQAGAKGARLTGAGFGGCAICLCHTSEREALREALIRNYYGSRNDFDPERHLFFAEPSPGALVCN